MTTLVGPIIAQLISSVLNKVPEDVESFIIQELKKIMGSCSNDRIIEDSRSSKCRVSGAKSRINHAIQFDMSSSSTFSAPSVVEVVKPLQCRSLPRAQKGACKIKF